MRKAVKNPDSKIVTENLNYVSGNSNNNQKIAELLLKEQKNFCAYTDEYISRTDAEDIDHFDPTLKKTPADEYHNWFVVKHQWNLEKSSKWKKFQPVLHPTADDFEERIVYLKGDYSAISKSDTNAVNTVKLLKLDDPELADKRKKYLQRKREDMAAYNQNALTFFTILLQADICHVSYPRALKEEFGLDILQILDQFL